MIYRFRRAFVVVSLLLCVSAWISSCKQKEEPRQLTPQEQQQRSGKSGN